MVKIDLTKYSLWQEVPEKGCIIYYRDLMNPKDNKALLNYIYDIVYGIKKQSPDDCKKDAEFFIIVHPQLFKVKGFKFPYVYFIQEVPVSSKMELLKELF